jgi:1-deoxy-D-xylulose-5-phosphate reductoisomerase
MTKRIAILGSTGSIGRQTLEVIDALGSGYRVVALTAASSDQLLAEQVIRFKPEMAALSDEEAAERMAKSLNGSECCLMKGLEGQIAAAVWPNADLVVMAQVGFSGFEPLIAALREGKKVALANKESLVIGGEILERLGLLSRDLIIPVDSEHSAIRQCLGSAPPLEVERVYLTASGGPFYGWSSEELEKVTPEMALKHPNWKMGRKISIDSATMMNKGLEVIEAKWLFNLSLDRIEVVVHRQSIIHSMVEYIDGSILAQLGLPDMRTAIQYALTYPERKKSRVKRYDPFGERLTFDRPDRDNFPCLDLACRSAKIGGTMPAVLNGANEIAVEYFLNGSIKFTEIPVIISRVMQKHDSIAVPEIEDIIDADCWSRREAAGIANELGGKVI